MYIVHAVWMVFGVFMMSVPVYDLERVSDGAALASAVVGTALAFIGYRGLKIMSQRDRMRMRTEGMLGGQPNWSLQNGKVHCTKCTRMNEETAAHCSKCGVSLAMHSTRDMEAAYAAAGRRYR